MKKTNTRHYVAILFIVIIAFILSVRAKEHKKGFETAKKEAAIPVLNDEFMQLFPGAAEIQETDTALFRVQNANDSTLGYLVYTSPYTDHILGFGGPTPLVIVLNADKEILDVTLLPENEESGSYMDYVIQSGLLDSWDQLDLNKALSRKVNAVSGATMSSEAIIETFQHRLSMLNKAHFDRQIAWTKIFADLMVILVLIFSLYCFFRPREAKNVRMLLLALSVLVLGLWQGKTLSLASDYNWLTNSINWSTQWILVLILGLSVLLPLFTGKSFYCTYLCPYGALQELSGKIVKRKIEVPERIRKIITWLRPLYLGVIILILLADLSIDLADFEPFAAFTIRSASTVVLVLAGLFLALSVFFSKPWCKWCCPTGTLLEQFKIRKDR